MKIALIISLLISTILQASTATIAVVNSTFDTEVSWINNGESNSCIDSIQKLTIDLTNKKIEIKSNDTAGCKGFLNLEFGNSLPQIVPGHYQIIINDTDFGSYQLAPKPEGHETDNG